MSHSVLIMGCSDSRHVYNFINVVLSDPLEFDDISIFNVAHVDHEPKEFEDYYQTRNIRVLNPSKKPSTKVGVLNSALNFTERTWALHQHLKSNHYDYLIVHYCCWQAMRWVNLFGNSFQKIFLVFYGGDVLRSRLVNKKFFQKAYIKATFLVLPNAHSIKVFNKKTGNLFKEKAMLIQFPQKMVRSYFEAQPILPEKEQVLNEFGIPANKVVVICGHTATRAERYEQVILELAKTPRYITNNCYFIFMMTYAPEEYLSYQHEIEEMLIRHHIPGCVLKEYLDYLQIQKLHSVSDIHITNIVTDALSCFLQEQMLAGSVVIYGKWLHYDDIENDHFYAIPFDNIGCLSETFINTFNNLTDLKELCKRNREGIINLASEETISGEWNNLLIS